MAPKMIDIDATLIDPIPDPRQSAFEHAREMGIDARLYVVTDGADDMGPDEELLQIVTIGNVDLTDTDNLPPRDTTRYNGFYFVLNENQKGVIASIPVDTKSAVVSNA